MEHQLISNQKHRSSSRVCIGKKVHIIPYNLCRIGWVADLVLMTQLSGAGELLQPSVQQQQCSNLSATTVSTCAAPQVHKKGRRCIQVYSGLVTSCTCRGGMQAIWKPLTYCSCSKGVSEWGVSDCRKWCWSVAVLILHSGFMWQPFFKK